MAGEAVHTSPLWLVKAFEVCYPSKSLAGKTVWARATCGPLATALIHPRLSRQSSRLVVGVVFEPISIERFSDE